MVTVRTTGGNDILLQKYIITSLVLDHTTFETGMMLVVIGGIVMVVTTVTVIEENISSRVIVTGGCEMVVTVDKLKGGKMKVQGG